VHRRSRRTQDAEVFRPFRRAGSAELKPDGSLTGEIRFHLGDEATSNARRW